MANSDKIHKSRSKKSKVVADEMTSFNYTYYLLVLITAITIALLHRNHISGMFESDRHFSHLSTLERELTFRTEMGLYYSYFKTIVDAPTFWNGLGQIMYDNVTEYPLVINTLKRFNLYPEVLLGAAYRIYDQVMSMLGKQTKICFKVNRGENLSPVQSCEGLGEKPYFYAESVFLLNGLNMATFFVFGLFLSGTYFGGLLCVLCFFYNHGECTRVQWAPPLRENFAYPFLVLQMLIVTYTIRSKTPSKKHVASIAISTICFMLPWQFAQFALLTQTLSILATYLLGFIASKTVQVIAGGQLIGLITSSILLFGNEMLVTSFFSASLVAIWVVLWMEARLKSLNLPRIVISIVQGISLIILTVVVKITISKLLNITDDEHIGDILRSKFSSFKNFHTMLYVCAPEFDFLELATPVRLLKTLLLPSSLVVVAAIFVQVILPQLRNLFIPSSSSSSSSSTATAGASPKQNGHHGHGDSKNGVGKHQSNKEPVGTGDKDTSCAGQGELVYHFFQLAAFTVMALIIMRLKLFWTPHLCLVSSLLASHKFFSWVGSQSRHTTVLVCLVAIMSFQGVSNLRSQWGIQGEFSNIQLEQLVDWINDNTPKDGVFAGPMPLMATIKLCTGRPIINHPHYEDAGLRERTKKVYLMFSRREIPYVWSVYKEMGIQYLIVEEHWCLRRPKPGCGMTDLWDMEEKDAVDGDAVCKKLYNDQSPYFDLLFKNEVYHVFRLVDHQD